LFRLYVWPRSFFCWKHLQCHVVAHQTRAHDFTYGEGSAISWLNVFRFYYDPFFVYDKHLTKYATMFIDCHHTFSTNILEICWSLLQHYIIIVIIWFLYNKSTVYLHTSYCRTYSYLYKFTMNNNYCFLSLSFSNPNQSE